MAKKKSTTKQLSPEAAQAALDKYESMFAEIDEFLQFVHRERDELKEADARVAATKSEYDAAKAEATALRDTISGAKDALFKLLEPGVMKFMPLFDRMEPADKELHGEHADEWRRDPISALRLSPNAAAFLIDADIILVGQLQDRVLANPFEWHDSVPGLTLGIAAAIKDRLNDYIFRDGGRG